jgi:predicted deacetylase
VTAISHATTVQQKTRIAQRKSLAALCYSMKKSFKIDPFFIKLQEFDYVDKQQSTKSKNQMRCHLQKKKQLAVNIQSERQ